MEKDTPIKLGSIVVPVKKFIYKDFRETYALDCGLPVFITYDDKYSFAKTIEEFEYGIENLSIKYFQKTTEKTFKYYFKSLAKFYKYPKEQAAKLLEECLNKFAQAKHIVVRNV